MRDNVRDISACLYQENQCQFGRGGRPEQKKCQEIGVRVSVDSIGRTSSSLNHHLTVTKVSVVSLHLRFSHIGFSTIGFDYSINKN